MTILQDTRVYDQNFNPHQEDINTDKNTTKQKKLTKN